MKRLITKVNNPRVRRVKGRVRIRRTGFREKLSVPKITAMIIAVTKSFTWTPARI